MKQCILTVSTWLMNSERSLKVTVDLSESYPTMEAQGPVPELLRKVLNAYDMVSKWKGLRFGTRPWPIKSKQGGIGVQKETGPVVEIRCFVVL